MVDLRLIFYYMSTVNNYMEVMGVLQMLKRLWVEEKGQGMAEYGLILALVAIIAAAALSPLGTKIANTFTTISNSL